MITVFGHEVEKGTKAYFQVPAGALANQAMLQIPVIVVAGQAEGPVLWINGTVHGDELNGSFAAWELSKQLNPAELSGTLIVTPICNPMAFECRSKNAAVDGLDMDTAFPGDPRGTLTQRVAYLIYQEIKKHATALISFHTIGTPFLANAYSVRKIVPVVPDSVNQTAAGMQKAFGVKTNCLVNLCGAVDELPGVTSGALDITCLQDHIPAFMGEMGQGGKIETCFVTAAQKGIVNVMIYLGLLKGELDCPGEQILITKRRFLRSDGGGLIRMNVKSGDIIRAGENLLDMHYYGESVHPVPAASDYYMIAVRENPVVSTGDRIAFAGTEWENW